MNGNGTPWPDPPHEFAYLGLAGEIVRAIQPYTEADPVALLAHLLAGFGSAIGRARWWGVEREMHHGNINVAIVGSTSEGRKGTAWGHARRLLESVDQDWASERILSGLSSGEGLVNEVRDADEEGPRDQRLLIVESEFAAVLRQAKRDGNILSTVIRQAWDSGTLRTLTKHSPLKATGAHVSIVGHITPEELRRSLDDLELFNGFGNRFIWLLVKRSKQLPFGGRISTVNLGPLIKRLQTAAKFGREHGEIGRDDEADEIWRFVYGTLTGEKPGLYGAVTARAAPQVMRLALIHAVMNESHVITKDHILAAIALWEYAERSARFIWKPKSGNPDMDKILAQLREMGSEGLSRTGISGLFARNRSVEVIQHALGKLEAEGLAECRSVKTTGRPAEMWFALPGGNERSANELGFFLLSYNGQPTWTAKKADNKGHSYNETNERNERKSIESHRAIPFCTPPCETNERTERSRLGGDE